MALDTTGESFDAFAAFAFDADGCLHGFAHLGLHGLAVRRQLGTIENHGAVGVDHRPARFGDGRASSRKQREAVGPFEFGGGVGEMLPDVAESGSSENGVGDGMGDHVGIAVATKAGTVVERDATEHEPAFRIIGPRVHIEPLTDPQLGNLCTITHASTLPHHPTDDRETPTAVGYESEDSKSWGESGPRLGK